MKNIIFRDGMFQEYKVLRYSKKWSTINREDTYIVDCGGTILKLKASTILKLMTEDYALLFVSNAAAGDIYIDLLNCEIPFEKQMEHHFTPYTINNARHYRADGIVLNLNI